MLFQSTYKCGFANAPNDSHYPAFCSKPSDGLADRQFPIALMIVANYPNEFTL